MKNQPIKLGAFWIEGTDKHFFGLRDAKNFQLVKGGNILGPHGNRLYTDPFPGAANCTNCGNRITPTGPFIDVPMEALPNKCADCGGKVNKAFLSNTDTEMAEMPKKEKKKGFFGLFGG